MWKRLTGLLLVGYLAFTRSFSYLGIPSLNVFVGESVLGTFLIFGRPTRNVLRIRPLRRLRTLLAIFLGFGLFEALRGAYLGHPVLAALRDLAFNYYGLYLLLGVYVGVLHPAFLSRFVRVLAWCNGLYGTAYILFLNRLDWTIPYSPDVPVFGQPMGSALSILGLLATEPAVSRVGYLIALNGFVLLGIQVRSEWLAFAVGLLVWSACARRFRRLIVAGVSLTLLVTGMYLANVFLPAPRTRGGAISVRSLVGRAIAPIQPELAATYVGSEEAQSYAGTVSWRIVVWRAVWGSVNADRTRMLLGHGYGFPISDLAPDLVMSTRSPHSFLFYALAYSGWVGLALFALVQAELLRLLRQRNRLLKLVSRPYPAKDHYLGLVFWSFGIVIAAFGTFFEAPYGAIPFYLLCGVAIGEMFSPQVLEGAIARRDG